MGSEMCIRDSIDDEEEEDGLLPAPSLTAALAIFGMVALIRRRI